MTQLNRDYNLIENVILTFSSFVIVSGKYLQEKKLVCSSLEKSLDIFLLWLRKCFLL